MKLNELERFKLRKFVKKLAKYRGRHTELVTVYIPAGYDLNAIIGHLSQEQGTAANIKSKQTRDSVVSALERMIQHLRLFKKTPEHGLAVFAGNVAEREGQSDIQVWSYIPPIPINFRTYRCDKEFLLEALKDMLDISETYALVVFDRRDAMLALLRGKTIIPLVKTHSEVPGKFRAGGQCVVKETLIQCCDGNILQIKKSHNPITVKSMIVNNFSLADSQITDKWEVKKSRIHKIVTKHPRLEVQASKDHVFFVVTDKGIEEKAAEELKEGDCLIMPEIIKSKGTAQKIFPYKYYNGFIINTEGKRLLRSARERSGLLQRELAKKVSVAQTTISSFETGKINASRTPLQKICKALKIDFDEFLEKYTGHSLKRAVKLPRKLDKDFAQFLGYLTGDGCIETDRITFFEQDKKLALEYKKKFDRYFRLDSSYRFREKKNYHQLRFTSRPLVRLVLNEFPEIKKAKNSLIPEKVLKSPDEILASFIRGLFDAEGYTSSRKQIALGINNKLLAQQLQMALLRFGIISSLHEYDNRANKYSDNPRFTVDLTEKQSLKAFEKQIGFSCEKKREKLRRAIQDKTTKSRVRQILIPGTKIRKIIENAGYNLESFPKVTNFFRNEKMMSKEVFKNSILKMIKDKELYKELRKVYDYPFLPVKISSIEVSNKKTEMIDISVENQNFIANGVIVHNSAQRFARLREGAAKDHYKKIAEYMKEEFLNRPEIKGIILGGPGTTVNDFMGKDYLTGDVKKKLIGTKDLSYTGEFGLQELLDKSGDLLAGEEVTKEKELMQKFFNYLAKRPRMVSYGKDEVMKNLRMGSVDMLLISEATDEDTLEHFEEESAKMGTKIEIISTETREGVQLRDMGKVVAILRYEVQS